MVLILTSLAIAGIKDLFHQPEKVAGLGLAIEKRTWSDMKEFFISEPDPGINPLIYEVLRWPVTGNASDLLVGVTVIYPGHIGDDPFHTKGHFHCEPDGSELVVGYGGEGVLQTATRFGVVTETPLFNGEQVVIPPGEGHRMVNRSNSPLYFLALSTAAVGHDYDTIVDVGWRRH